MHTGALAFTKSWGETTQRAPARKNFCFKSNVPLGQVPAHQPRRNLLNYTSSYRMSFVQKSCKLSNQGASGVGGWSDALLRRGRPYLIWPAVNPCRSFPFSGPWWFCCSLCRTSVCTGRGSLGRTKGDTGNLAMVSVQARCRDRTRGGRTGCGGTWPPRRQFWKLQTSVPSLRNRLGWVVCRLPVLAAPSLSAASCPLDCPVTTGRVKRHSRDSVSGSN